MVSECFLCEYERQVVGLMWRIAWIGGRTRRYTADIGLMYEERYLGSMECRQWKVRKHNLKLMREVMAANEET